MQVCFWQSLPGGPMSKHFHREQSGVIILDQSSCLIPRLRWNSQAALRVLFDSSWLFVHP